MRHTKTWVWILSAIEQMEQEAANLKAGTDMWKKAYTERVSESTERLLRIQKFEAEIAEYKRQLVFSECENKRLKEALDDNRLTEPQKEVQRLNSRWEELKEVIEEEEKLTSKLHDDFNTGSRAAYGVVLDMMGELSHKLLEQKKGMK